jgi:hypothetical protein
LPTYSLPEQLIGGYQALAKLSADTFARVLEVVHSTPPAPFPPAFARQVAKAFGDKEDTVYQALIVGLSAETLRQADDSDPAELANDLSSAPELRVSDVRRRTLAERLVALFGATGVRLSVRASQLALSDERLFVGARGSVSVRPVFDGSRAESAPASLGGAFLIYSMQISFHQYNRDDAITLALDAEDLQKLRAELDRVEGEAKALESVLRTAGVVVFSNDGGEL